MATRKGANKTIIDAITPSTILDPGKMGGNVRCLIDTYTSATTEAASDTIEMGADLPVGARILWGVIVQDTVGGNTLDVGDASDPNRYVDAAADNTTTDFTDVNTGVGYTIVAATTQIILTLSGDLTAAGKVTLIVLYTVE